MFYLPPLPDDAIVNGPGHVEDSEKLEAFLIALAELDKVVIDPLPVPEPGTVGHIKWHNAMVKDIKTVADSLGVPVTLPPLDVKTGDHAHVTHHNVIKKALEYVQDNAWNDATGGTVTNFDKDGKRYRLHTFNESGIFTIKRAARPFRVLLIGGGGSCIYGDKGPPGGGGGVLHLNNEGITTGNKKLTVGTSGNNTIFESVGTAYAGFNGRENRCGDAGASGAPTSFAGAPGDYTYATGGGGGAGAAGGGVRAYELGGVGGDGIANDITGDVIYYGGGGGGSHNTGINPPCPGGRGGGGGTNQNGVNGLGGGGGGGTDGITPVGGSGMAIISYEIGKA